MFHTGIIGPEYKRRCISAVRLIKDKENKQATPRHLFNLYCKTTIRIYVFYKFQTIRSTIYSFSVYIIGEPCTKIAYVRFLKF